MAGLRRYVRAGGDVLRDAGSWRPGRQTSENTYLVARRLHGVTGGVSSRLGLALVRAVHERSGDAVALADEWSRCANALVADGVTYTPPVLTPEAVERVREFAMTAPAVLTSTSGARSRGTLRDRRPDTAGVHIVEQFVLDQPDIQSIIANADVSDLARTYFKATPVMHPPQLYWSCAGARMDSEAAKSAARAFHWDYDGLGGLRLHLYLTDVDEGAAPMEYVVGSHAKGGLRSATLRRADLGVDDEDLWASYSRASVVTLTGPAGTAFVSDSGGLHRGNDAVTRDRLFLVMPMQATGFAGYQLRPRRVTPVDPRFRAGLEQRRVELSFFIPRDGSSAETR